LIQKVVIPAAGLGTRLLPSTKEMPKEMLPIPVWTKGELRLKPMLQAVYEQSFQAGFRQFCFIVGRGKRGIEDHFTPDEDYISFLRAVKKEAVAEELAEFYRMISDSSIIFVNQPVAKGFGDSIHKAKVYTGGEDFLMHAGDDLVISPNNSHITRLSRFLENSSADCAFLVERVKDPRSYGVITGERLEKGVIRVNKIVEKPEKPETDLAIVAIYAFKPVIYRAIEHVTPDTNGEIQLSDALIWLLEQGFKVYGITLQEDERRIDIGTPESYVQVISTLSSQVQTAGL